MNVLSNLIFCSRRSLRFAWLFIILLFAVHSSPLFAQLAGGPWPMFMHDIQHTGQSIFKGPQKNTLSWQYSTKSEIAASPVLGGDGTIYVGDAGGKFHAIGQDGKKKWPLPITTGDAISAAAAVDANGVVYFGSEDGYLYAVQKDGSLAWKWKYKAEDSVSDSDSINTSPVISPRDAAIYFGSNDKYVYALDTAGKLIWSAALDEEVWASPVLDTENSLIYIATLSGMVYAINTSDGTVKWKFPTEDAIMGSPAFDRENGIIFLGSGGGKIYALNASDGSPRWIYPRNGEVGEIYSTPAIDTATDSNAVYVGSNDGYLYALDRKTGALKWRFEETDKTRDGGAIASSPAIDRDGNIYFGCKDNYVYSISKEGGLNWKFETKDDVDSSPAIGANGLLYIGSSDGNIYAIGAKTTTTLTADFTATPTTGELPLTVQFTDKSAGAITDWLWDFGDGATDSAQNPSHTYNKSGNFTVSLTVIGPGGSGLKTRENYISVTRKHSAIELNLSDSEITFGESLTITGKISPAHEAQVTLTFTDAEGGTDIKTATSSADGSFILADYFPTEGGAWDVAASWDGDSDHAGAESSSLTFTVNPAQVTLTITPSASTIQTDQTVDIAGIITLTPDSETVRNEFLNEELKLIRTNPDGEYEDVIETGPFLSGNQIQYIFEGVTLSDTGVWNLLTGLDKDDSFKGASSAAIEIEVHGVAKEEAGYAILVEGRAANNSGIDSHNLTTNAIHEKLLDRGFSEENIYYFNFDNTQSGVDETPARNGVLDAVKTWAREKMNESPAPLYIIFVGHGEKEKFLIYSSDKKYDNITAGDLSDALGVLESGLITDALKEPVVIVLGANRSGSFIKTLSKSGANRIIIASSDSEEIAYKGPLPPDETIRHGDYFVWEFFKHAAEGLSLRKCYETAADSVSEFTENEKGNGLITTENGQIKTASSAGNGQYFDFSAQHPLLDDNGDGRGTFGKLSSLSKEDGGLSTNLVMGVGSATASLELTEVTDVITLEAKDPAPTLFARVNDPARVSMAWIEVISPNHSLENKKDATEQQVIDLPRFGYGSFDTSGERYLWDDFSGNKAFDNFKKSGSYEIFYFARDINRGDITSFMESNVFRNGASNQPPSSFKFLSPADGSETTIALIFDWEDSKDKDSKKKGVTYTFMISENSDFNPIYYQQKGLTDSIAVVDKTAGLHDGTTYYWRVMAVDSDGGVTFIEAGTPAGASAHGATSYGARGGASATGASSSFKPRLANGYTGIISGFVFDNDTNAKLSGAAITIQGAKGSYATTDSGAYYMTLLSGTYTVSVDASGYETTTKTVRVKALDTTEENIGLTVAVKPTGISGNVKDKKGNPVDEVTITVKKKKFTKTATTDSGGNYSITGLDAGKYKLTASKKGYKNYKQNITLKTGQGVTLNIQLSKKK